MKINYFYGDVFEADGPVAHGCNTLGLMGAGIANVVRVRYPNTYLTYRSLCWSGSFQGGDFLPVWENGRWIFNLATQTLPGRDANLSFISLAMTDAVDFCNDNNIPAINMPLIGCGIGGLVWPQVVRVLDNIVTHVEANVYVVDRNDAIRMGINVA